MTINKSLYPILFILLACTAAGTSVTAQVLFPDQPGNRPLLLANEQLQQQHYVLAAQSCRQYMAHMPEKPQIADASDEQQARYIKTVAGIKADVPHAMADAKEFLRTTGNGAYAQRTAYAIAQYYFLRDRFADAIPYYESAGIDNLSNTEIADQKFELAYCYFNNHQFDRALPLFSSIKELKGGKYYKAGNYYYGLLAYNVNNYKDALESFGRIRDDREYRTVVPYYIAEVNYFMGNKAKALEEAKADIEARDKSYYDNELHLLAAQILFEQEHYADARPYFEYYYDHSTQIRKEDLYKIAYCFYRLDDWKGAIDKFKMLNNTQDSLGQSSMYLLGDCYLKITKTGYARNAYGLCAEMPYNKGQQEASMILYARLSYRIGHNDEAVRMLNLLLRTFPQSEYRDEAKTLLSDVLLKTNNFADALRHLDEVNKKEDRYWKVYQKAAYGYAVQQFRDGNLAKAYTFFNFSLQHPVNSAYECAAYFWSGEIAYRQRNFNEAISNCQQFVNRKCDENELHVLSPQATQQHAYLNMGFAAMESQNYSSAQNFFNKASQVKDGDNYSGMVATLREADAVFMQQNYVKAITLYDRIIASDPANADYARYQKSIIMGLQGKNNEKLTLLLSLVNNPQPSAYANQARYEAAVTCIEMDKYPQALIYLQQLADNPDAKALAPKAWMKIGFISQQVGDNANAITSYKHVVTDYPASDERMAALDALRSLYIQGNQPGAYAQLLRDNNLPSADSSAIDSTYYAAAETQFSTGKWESARAAFASYLALNAHGIFAVRAHYYRGESEYQLKQYPDALRDFDTVLAYPWNDFAENSARHAAAISFDAKSYGAAYDYYGKLRMHVSNNPQSLQTAFAGLMRSGYNSGKFEESGLYADTLLAMQGTPAELINEALLYKARTLQHFGKADTAIALYRQLSGNQNGEMAAESRYRIAEIEAGRDSLKDAENAANDAIKMSSGYDYWIVKSYILLADILTKENDYFNAKATLESIVKHTKIAELKDEAAEKLTKVKELEKSQSKLKEE